jgi:TRAP transporter TAXI family solute receptor
VRHLLALSAVLALVAPCATHAEQAPLRLGTGTAGGGFQAYGEALAVAIHGADPRLAITPVPTKGSTENLPMLEDGRLDLALVTGEVAHEALHGAAGARVRVLSVAYPSPAMFAVRAESPFRRIEDLKGTPVVFGARGSGLVVLARCVLDGMGLDLERDFRPILLDRAEQGPDKVLSGEASAMWGGGTAWPPFQRIAAGPGGARFLVPDAAAIGRITGRYPFLRPMTVAAGSYPGQVAPVASIGTWTLVLVRADLPAEVVSRVSRALRDGARDLAGRVPQGSETTLANTAANVAPGDLHPGVLSVLRGERLEPHQAEGRNP